MKNKIWRLCLRILRMLFPSLTRGASILMYHSVGNNDAFFTVTPADFERQMQYLSRGFRVVPLRLIVERLRNGESIAGMVALTFDDGLKDNLTNVLPVITRFGFPITIFVSTGLIDGTYTTSAGVTLPMLSRQDLSVLARHPLVELMPHTRTHADLSVLAAESYRQEIEGSRSDLAGFGHKIDMFAYPKGRFNGPVQEYLRTHGWSAAVGVKKGLVDAKSDLYALPRNSIDSAVSFEMFTLKLSDGIYWYFRLKKLFV